MGSVAAGKPPVQRHYIHLDLLRCIAIYLVIGLHCISGILTDGTLFATRSWWAANLMSGLVRMGVPLFFMISGALLLSDPRTLDVKNFYRRRMVKLLPPFLTWDVLYFLSKCVVFGVRPNPLNFFKELVQQGSEYHLWFVYQIIALYLFMPFLKRIVDHCTVRELLVFLGVVLLQPTLFRLLNVVQTAVVISPFLAIVEGYTGFLLTGYLLSAWEPSPKARCWLYLLGVAGLMGCAYGNYAGSSIAEILLYGNEGYFITQYMTSSACFVLAKQTASQMPGWLKRVTGKISMLTYGIYLSHVLVMDVAVRVLWRLGVELSPITRSAVLFLATSLFATLAVWIASHIPVARKLLL